jgi:hypothetical protein
MFGALNTAEGVAVLAGTLGAGFLSRFAGIIPVLAVQGGAYVIGGLALLAWLRDPARSPSPEPGQSAAAGRPGPAAAGLSLEEPGPA